MSRKCRMGNQKGFTLVEIIAVLLLLGILTAVALPKYLAMQAEVEYQTLNLVVNDIKSRAMLKYSASFLEGNGTADPDDSDTYTELGLPDTDALNNVYKDFKGTFVRTSENVITYSPLNTATGISTATVTLAGGDAENPSTVVLEKVP